MIFEVKAYIEEETKNYMEVLTSVAKDGEDQVIKYVGRDTVQHEMAGPVPYQFEIEADNLEDAFSKFDKESAPVAEETKKKIDQHIFQQQLKMPGGQ